MIKNVFFDFNGTILNDLDLSYSLVVKSCERCNAKKPTLEEYLNNFSFPVKQYYESLGFDWTKYDYENVESKFFIDEYSSLWQKKSNVFDEFLEVAKILKEKGIKLYILSATERELLNKQLTFFNIKDLFDGVSCSDNIHAKGKVEYGNDFLNDNNIDRSSTILIGDTIYDYDVANKLNLKPILFSKGHNSKERLMKTNAPIIDNLLDLLNFII